MLKMSVNPSEFSIVKPCSRFAVRSVLQRYRATGPCDCAAHRAAATGSKQKRPIRAQVRKNKNGALGFPLPFCGIIKRVPKKDVNLPFACEGDLSRKTDGYDKQQSPGSEQLE